MADDTPAVAPAVTPAVAPVTKAAPAKSTAPVVAAATVPTPNPPSVDPPATSLHDEFRKAVAVAEEAEKVLREQARRVSSMGVSLLHGNSVYTHIPAEGRNPARTEQHLGGS